MEKLPTVNLIRDYNSEAPADLAMNPVDVIGWKTAEPVSLTLK